MVDQDDEFSINSAIETDDYDSHWKDAVEHFIFRMHYRDAITQTVTRLAGMGAAVDLFGSRLNDQTKGGDIDLFIESDTQLSLTQRAQIKMQRESQLGLPVDVVSKYRGAVTTPFHVIAQSQSTLLEI